MLSRCSGNTLVMPLWNFLDTHSAILSQYPLSVCSPDILVIPSWDPIRFIVSYFVTQQHCPSLSLPVSSHANDSRLQRCIERAAVPDSYEPWHCKPAEEDVPHWIQLPVRLAKESSYLERPFLCWRWISIMASQNENPPNLKTNTHIFLRRFYFMFAW